jgi:chemotaxis receptor (MCP) glutamine deamidase CheD
MKTFGFFFLIKSTCPRCFREAQRKRKYFNYSKLLARTGVLRNSFNEYGIRNMTRAKNLLINYSIQVIAHTIARHLSRNLVVQIQNKC